MDRVNGLAQKVIKASYFHFVILIGLSICNIGMANTNSSSQQISKGEVPQGLNQIEWKSIQSQITTKQYKSHPHGQGGYSARNSSHNWNIHYQSTGTTSLTPKNGDDYKIDLKLNAFGYQQLTPMAQPIAITNQDNAVTYQWSNELKEVWTNSAQSLEQWFILEQRPKNYSKNNILKVELNLTTNLSINQQADGLHFSNSQGVDISYTKLKVWDKDGTILPSKMLLANNTLTLKVDDTHANYPLTIDPIFQQQAYLKASNMGASDNFGYSVAISGDTLVVGAIGEDSSTIGVDSTPDESAAEAGAAYVFIRDTTTGAWSQQAYLKASNTDAIDLFGVSVSISGDTIVVGAENEDSATTGVNSTPNESALSSGAAYVFIRNGAGLWSQQAYLKASNTGAGDNFGYAVAISGDTIVVGALQEDSSTTGVNSTPNESAAAAGAAYVFFRDTTIGTWSQQAYLKASNTGASDLFGILVAVSGDTVVVGAPNEDSSSIGVNSTPNELADQAGAAYVFIRDAASNWSQQAFLKASNTGAGDQFGYSVAVTGNMVVVGAPTEASSTTGVDSTPDESAAEAGAAYVFTRDGLDIWSQQAYLKAFNTGANDLFGLSVAVTADTVVVGAIQEDSSNNRCK